MGNIYCHNVFHLERIDAALFFFSCKYDSQPLVINTHREQEATQLVLNVLYNYAIKVWLIPGAARYREIFI